jgi:hypothetical protein
MRAVGLVSVALMLCTTAKQNEHELKERDKSNEHNTNSYY